MAGNGMGLGTAYGAGAAAQHLQTLLAQRLAQEELAMRQQAMDQSRSSDIERMMLTRQNMAEDSAFRMSQVQRQDEDRAYAKTRDAENTAREDSRDAFNRGVITRTQAREDARDRFNHVNEDPAVHQQHVLADERRQHGYRMAEIGANKAPRPASDVDMRTSALEMASRIAASPQGILAMGDKSVAQLAEEFYQSMKGSTPKVAPPVDDPREAIFSSIDQVAQQSGGYDKLLAAARDDQELKAALGPEGHAQYLARIHERAKASGKPVGVRTRRVAEPQPEATRPFPN